MVRDEDKVLGKFIKLGQDEKFQDAVSCTPRRCTFQYTKLKNSKRNSRFAFQRLKTGARPRNVKDPVVVHAPFICSDARSEF
ncbi:hypothetical protein EVAR_76467_1 [Eumeta japonica]|uniref:Uncharacterized protein n=1 Tax=Eumeta variegata TaxID=151549 RepID=A0A4C1T7L0_EUMVA|nr:hypothetical protein EVAR_76467_1 [Eumeta japonica]